MKRLITWVRGDEEQRARRRYNRMVAEATRYGGSVPTYYAYRHGVKPPVSRSPHVSTTPKG